MNRGPVFRSLQSKFRARRFLVFEGLLRKLLASKREIAVLDAGGRAEYWSFLADDLRPRVSITVLNFAEDLQLHGDVEDGLRIEFVVGDACHMPQYEDRSFDVVHSNSVIEHVGSYSNMERFAREVARVGRVYYVQTPSFWFPIDPHYGVPFFHWLPDVSKFWLLQTLKVGYAPKCDFSQAIAHVDNVRIINRAVLRRLFPDATIRNERLMFATKSMMAVRA